MSSRTKISRQYLQKKAIPISILKIKHPAHFIVKECISGASSAEARDFLEAEEAMQKYYGSLESNLNQLPLKDTVLVAEVKKKFYRAKVCKILFKTDGHLFRIYLIDYGRECEVRKDKLFEIQKDFLAHPHQAVEFKLIGLEPISLVMNPLDLTLSSGPVETWDVSCIGYIEKLINDNQNFSVEVKGVEDNCIVGSLFYQDDCIVNYCVNDELITKKFAQFNEDNIKNVQSIDVLIEREMQLKNKSIPVRKKTMSSLPETTISESTSSIQLNNSDRKDHPLFIKCDSPSANDVMKHSPVIMREKIMASRPETVIPESICGSISNSQSSNSDTRCHPLFIKCDSPNANDVIKHSPVMMGEKIMGSRPEVVIPESTSESISSRQLSNNDRKCHPLLKKCDSPNVNNVINHSPTMIREKIMASRPETAIPECISSGQLNNDGRDNFLIKCNLPNADDLIQHSPVMMREKIMVSPPKTTIPEGISRGELINNDKKSYPLSISYDSSNANDILKHSPVMMREKIMASRPEITITKSNFDSISSRLLSNNDGRDNLLVKCDLPNADDVMKHSNVVMASPTDKAEKPTDKKLPDNFLRLKKVLTSSKVLLCEKEISEKSSELPLTPLKKSNEIVHLSSLNLPACKAEETSPSCADASEKPAEKKLPNNFLKLKKVLASSKVLLQEKEIHIKSPERPSTSLKISNSDQTVNLSNPNVPAFECEAIPSCTDKPKTPVEKKLPDNFLKLRNILSSSKVLLQKKDIQLKSPERPSTSLNTSNSDQAVNLSNPCDMQDEDFTPNLSHMTNMDFSSLWEKQEVPALQIGAAPLPPIKTTNEANFPPSLCKILKSIKFVGPTCIQSVVWPAVLRHRNVIAIAPPHSGKTVAYLLPIASQFHSLHYEDLPSGNGPIAIIVCSSWKAVQAVYELCCLFMQNAHVKVITLYADGRKFNSKVTSILNGCDVLITTPHEFLKALKDKVVDFSRCCHLIMDDGDKLIAHHNEELKGILLNFVEEAKEKCHDAIPSMIMCAERWNKKFALINEKLMTCSLLCFTSFLEAAVYAKVPFFTHVCTSLEKQSTLLSILENSNTVICTTNAEDALEVYNFLSCESIRTHLVTERMEQHTSLEKIKDWKSVHSTLSPNCLIITDAALTLMPVSSARCLIHFDIPRESRLQFGNRFSCIAENFLEKDEKIHHSCHVLISEECPLLATCIIDVIKRSCKKSSRNIPEVLKEIANKNKEAENMNSPLCHYMKAYGCCKQKLCQQRHIIDPIVDAPKAVPKEGDVQAFVTHVIDASHFFVRVLKYVLPDTKNAVCLSAQYAKTGFLLKEFYSSESNRKVVKNIIIGEMYVIEEEMLFYRIKVLAIQTSKLNQEKIQILFLDEGWVKWCEHVVLYDLSENLELPSHVVVEVYLCEVATLDSCADWNPQANHFISELILEKEIYGKIMLCIGETLWLHPIALRTKLFFLNEYLNMQNIHKALIEHDFAKENRNHLNLLRTACEGKVTVPAVINEPCAPEEIAIEQSQINYAFLECNVDEEIYVSSVISPQQLYVQRKKFTDCLDDLIMKINDGVEKNKYRKCKKFHLGMYCIAPFHEDDKFYRAMVTDVKSDNESVDLFYIDFGDSGVATKNDIYVIGPELLLLPFQAIECELRNVNATHGGWSEKTIDYLTDLTRDDAGDMKIMTLTAYKKEASYGGGNHYIVDIWVGAKSLSEYLVQAGLAEQVETILPIEPASEPKVPSLEEEPPGYAESSDDRDPDDKDCEALFCCVLSKLVLESHKYSNANDALADAIRERESQATITEIKDEENESKIDASPILKSDANDASERRPSSLKHPYLQKVLKCYPELQPRRPLISWWDTPNQVYIAINVKDITTYNLDLHDHGFKFHTSLKNAVYSTEEQFYSDVHSQNVIKHLSSQSLNLTLHKKAVEKWPRFTKESGKFLHIKYNLEHLDDSESEENVSHTSVNENNYSSKDCDIAPFPSDESDESSTDHDEKYVEPWRTMAEYKDPYNPLD